MLLAVIGMVIAATMLLLTRDIVYGGIAAVFLGIALFGGSWSVGLGSLSIRKGGGGANWVDGLVLIDPRFNLREVAKQMILLEDHLFHRNKHCRDCISKHTLYIEGLLEEALTMDTDRKYADVIAAALSDVKELLPPLIKKMRDKTATDEDYTAAAIALRKTRKPIAVEFGYYDA